MRRTVINGFVIVHNINDQMYILKIGFDDRNIRISTAVIAE